MKIRLCVVAALVCGLTVLAPVFAGGGKDTAGKAPAKRIVVADANSTHHGQSVELVIK